MEHKFKENIEKYQEVLHEKHRVYGHIANIRLLIMVLGGYTTYRWVMDGSTSVWAIISVVVYGIFYGFIRKHQGIKEEMERLEALVEVNQKYMARLGQEWQAFEDDGNEALDLEHAYAYDLDIIGPRSLFQKINATHTWFGRQKLLKALLEPDFSREKIEVRQKAIAELGHDLNFCQRIEGIKQIKIATKPERLLKYVTATDETFTKAWWKIWANVMGILAITLLGISIMFEQDLLGICATVLMGINLILQYIYILKINEAKGMLNSIVYDLGAYNQLIEMIESKNFHTSYLVELKDQLFGATHHAKEGIRQLEHLSNKANISYQPIAAIVLNALWVWDMKVMIELEAWKQTYGAQVQGYLETIGEIESLVSLAMLEHIEEQTVFPIIEEKGKVIEGTAMGHPLIAPKQRISNDVAMKEQIFIITGSNMSGKTTFLRTLGVQLVLAYAGASVPAKQFRCSRMAVHTSMRIRDDLSEGISTFYAELTRIKSIVEASKKSAQMCFLIDEIFRGTNSLDRITGAKSVIKGLQSRGAIGAMTTHDLEICQLEEKDKILNYHFTESYSENQIHFDYQLKEGPSTTTNAKYLMRMVGIEIIE